MTETHKAIAVGWAVFVLALAGFWWLLSRPEFKSLGSGYLDATGSWRKWRASLKTRGEAKPWTVRVGEAVMQWVAAMRLGER